MDESLNTIDQKRLMAFTSLIRLFDLVSHARVTQMHKFFVKYIETHPSNVVKFDFDDDHLNMKEFLRKHFPFKQF